MAVVYLGLGSNLGDRFKNIHDALELLGRSGVKIEKSSSILETDPMGGPAQGKFFNCAVKALTDLSPTDLLSCVNKIEQQLGRVRTLPNGPRTIDIDILLYDQQNIQTPTLTIPHPRMNKRPFVLVPLKEISPEIVKELH